MSRYLIMLFGGCLVMVSASCYEKTPSASFVYAQCDENIDCDNNNTCDGLERCVQGECERGEPLDCNDGADCTRDECLPAYGCRSKPNDQSCGSEVQYCDVTFGCLPLPPDWACFDGWDMDGDGLWDCKDPECYKVCEAWSPCPDYCSDKE